MEKIINGEAPFQLIKGDRFSVAPTDSGYVVAYSVDGINYEQDTDAVVPANKSLLYIGAMTDIFYKLSGNTSNNVKVIL